MSSPSITAPPRRSVEIDATRGVAVLSMYVAHFSIGKGPLEFLELSEYLTAALFATVIGAGAEAARHNRRDVGRRAAIGVAIRALALVLLGWWLATLGSQIVVVLTWLGALTVVCAGLVRLATPVLVALLIAAYAVGPIARSELALSSAEPNWLVSFALTHSSYWLIGFVVHALTGVLLVRALRRPRVRAVAVPWGGLVALAAGFALFLGGVQGRLDVAAYSGTHLELLLTTCLCLGTLAVIAWAVRALPVAVTLPLVATGGMALSLYVLQIVVSAVEVARVGDDDSYVLMVGFALASVALALTWRAVGSFAVRRGESAAWVRGPLEGLIAAVVAVVIMGIERLRGRMGGSSP